MRTDEEKREMAAARARAYRARRGARAGRRGPAPSAACGTQSGYNRHYRQGERPCEACRLARREWERAARARRRMRND